jgi:DNA-binding transcriptional MerR regulator
MEKSVVGAALKPLPPIPAKRYFTIGEVAELCQVKAYVLRYWEQEFTQLKPMKRRGNRRYYQHHEVLLIRRIRDLLYEQGFTITGARMRLQEAAVSNGKAVNGVAGHAAAEARSQTATHGMMVDAVLDRELDDLTVAALQGEQALNGSNGSNGSNGAGSDSEPSSGVPRPAGAVQAWSPDILRAELLAIRRLLTAL